jgi:hypothetical protein
MAKKQIVITLTNPQPCKFNGKDLEIKAELIPASLKAISECIRNFVGQLIDASDLEVASEPRIKLALDSDHYRGTSLLRWMNRKVAVNWRFKNFLRTFLMGAGRYF